MNAYKEIGRVCDRLDVGRRAKVGIAQEQKPALSLYYNIIMN